MACRRQSVSVGIELEFMLGQHQGKSVRSNIDQRWACSPQLFDTTMHEPEINGARSRPFDDELTERSCVLKVCNLIASKGLPVACKYLHMQPEELAGTGVSRLCYDDGDLNTWNAVEIAKAPNEKERILKQHDFWMIVPERHITRDCWLNFHGKAPSPKFNWVGIELNTPIIESPKEFLESLPTLRNSLTALRDNVVMGLNQDCGFHLHVNDDRYMELYVAKRITALVWLLEDALLYPICHPYRSKSPFSMRISTESKLKQMSNVPEVQGEGIFFINSLISTMEKYKERKRVDPNLIDSFKRLFAQPDMYELGQSLRKFDEGPVHTTRRCGFVITTKNTAEFRYPESTFDVDYIACWADLTRHLYTMALTQSPAEFCHTLCRVYENITRDTVPGWETMMYVVGARANLDQWARRIRQYHESGSLVDLNKQGIIPRATPAEYLHPGHN